MSITGLIGNVAKAAGPGIADAAKGEIFSGIVEAAGVKDRTRSVIEKVLEGLKRIFRGSTEVIPTQDQPSHDEKTQEMNNAVESIKSSGETLGGEPISPAKTEAKTQAKIDDSQPIKNS
ncbi:MAG: hypothetical protein AAF621_04105 [Pseudomonadota bacterium]